MYSLKFKFSALQAVLLTLAALVLTLTLAPTALAQNNKVVVIPLAGDSVDPKLVPIVVGAVLNPGGFVGTGISDMSNSLEGTYLFTLSKPIAGPAPVVLITPATNNRTANYSPSDDIITVHLYDQNGVKSNGSFSIVVYEQVVALPNNN